MPGLDSGERAFISGWSFRVHNCSHEKHMRQGQWGAPALTQPHPGNTHFFQTRSTQVPSQQVDLRRPEDLRKDLGQRGLQVEMRESQTKRGLGGQAASKGLSPAKALVNTGVRTGHLPARSNAKTAPRMQCVRITWTQTTYESTPPQHHTRPCFSQKFFLFNLFILWTWLRKVHWQVQPRPSTHRSGLRSRFPSGAHLDESSPLSFWHPENGGG